MKRLLELVPPALRPKAAALGSFLMLCAVLPLTLVYCCCGFALLGALLGLVRCVGVRAGAGAGAGAGVGVGVGVVRVAVGVSWRLSCGAQCMCMGVHVRVDVLESVYVLTFVCGPCTQ